MDAPHVRAKAYRCARRPEKRFDRAPELNPGWVVAERKSGYVYIVKGSPYLADGPIDGENPMQK